jgi:putative tricarboxylic transport membrane protein
MRAADLATAGVLMLLGGVVIYDAAQLGIGWGGEGPGSGFFPFWLAALLLVFSATIFVQAWRRSATRPFATRAQLGPVLKVLVPVAAFVFMTDPPGSNDGLGLYVAAMVYIATYMRWVGRHAWPLVVVVAVAVPIVAFVVFEQWFLVPMPKGPLEGWLGY